ncbi:MAG: RNA-binding protein, partial [Pseudomonadota bacterium]
MTFNIGKSGGYGAGKGSQCVKAKGHGGFNKGGKGGKAQGGFKGGFNKGGQVHGGFKGGHKGGIQQ